MNPPRSNGAEAVATNQPVAAPAHKTIRFSVLIPTYNRRNYIGDAINSVLEQSFKDFEVLVIDDGSTDNTQEVLEPYGARIKVITQANRGPEVARNTGAAAARGEYLAFLDSDDLLLPGALAAYNQVIVECGSPPLILGSVFWFEDKKKAQALQTIVAQPLEVLTFRDFLGKDRPIGTFCSRIVVRKSAFDEVGGHRNSSSSTWHADDLDLLIKLGTHSPCIVVQAPYTFGYRVHTSNSVEDPTKTVAGILSLVRREHEGHYPGGKDRRLDRYSMIGTAAIDWAKRSRRAGLYQMALHLLFTAAPMVLAAMFTKLRRFFHKPLQSKIVANRNHLA